MYLFVKCMAFFWTLAETAILLAVHWGHVLATGGERRLRGTLIGAGIAIGLLGSLLFLGETVLGRFFDLESRLPRTLYRWALWNFFCTVWVVLEGGIMVYVGRLYRILRRAGEPGAEGTKPAAPPFAGLCALAAAFLLLFGVYQAGLIQAVDRFGLEVQPVVRISLFYIRICGVFWILFEWVVAVRGLQAYRALKRRGGG